MTEANRSKVRVDQDDPTIILATEIKALADAAQRMLRGPLARRAILVLLRDRLPAPKLTLVQIDAVLEALPELRRYVK